MATQTIKIVEGNTGPPITLTAQRTDGTNIDLTGCTVSLIITLSGTVTNTGHQTCTIVTPASGICTYTPHTGDFTTKGIYICDLQVVYGDGSIERLYDQLKFNARLKAESTT